MTKDKVVLAYSGGLDTSVIISWMVEQGYEVYAICLNLGQVVEDLELIRKKASIAGAKETIVEDVREEFVSEYVFPSLVMNAVYEGTYLLGTALARPLIAKKQVEYAKRVGALSVSHGATGKGNDQVRFEMGYLSLMPDVNIVNPWKMPAFYEKYPGRKELIAYAKEKNIPIKATSEQPWSSDENLMHISFESGMLEDPWEKPHKEMFELSSDPKDAPDKYTEISIDFEEGLPVALNHKKMAPHTLLENLNKIAGENGIGRIDIVESRYVGMKSRGVYETPGATVLSIAHRAIESITLTRDVIDLKDSLMPRFAKNVYNGFWFTPETELILQLGKNSQKFVTGTVRMELYKGNTVVTGRKSPYSLYDEDIASMEKDQGRYNPQDAVGFIQLNALPYRIYRRILEKN